MVLTKNQVDTLENIARYLDVEFRANYSGRGMYGRRCVGFDIPQGTNPVAFGMRFATMMKDAGEDDLADLMSEAALQDSMGLGSVVYFPGIQAPELDKDEEESDDE